MITRRFEGISDIPMPPVISSEFAAYSVSNELTAGSTGWRPYLVEGGRTSAPSSSPTPTSITSKANEEEHRWLRTELMPRNCVSLDLRAILLGRQRMRGAP